MSESATTLRSPTLGAARNASMRRTIAVFLAGIRRVSDLRGRRLLDVGCGDGSFTIPLGAAFEEVHGVDVQPDNIEKFKAKIFGDSKYSPRLTSAARLEFPDGYFDAILTIETLEHVDNLAAVASECARVLAEGGQLVLTVPNRWFPVEGHGGTICGEHFNRLPLITYVPWLHRRWADARVFTVASLDKLFVPLGLKRKSLSYLWPTFEHGGNRLQNLVRWTFPLMRVMETSPLRVFGTSIVARYEKENRT